MKLELNARVRIEDDRSLWADVEELPGCFASGESLPDLVDALKEAIVMCIEDDDDHASEICLNLRLAPVRVPVPA